MIRKNSEQVMTKSSYYSSICPDELMKITRTSVRIAIVLAKIRTEHHPNTIVVCSTNAARLIEVGSVVLKIEAEKTGLVPIVSQVKE
jgi:hypothetical protein